VILETTKHINKRFRLAAPSLQFSDKNTLGKIAIGALAAGGHAKFAIFYQQ